MKITIKAFLILIIVGFTVPASAQGWASVDTRLLMVLHPQMGNYDYSAGRFFRQSFSPQRNKNLYEELNKAAKESEKKLASLTRKETSLIEKRADLLTERDITINDLAEKAASTTYNIRGKYERVAEYERRFEEKLAQLDQQLQNLYLEMEAVRDAAYAPVYLSRIETGNKLIEIKRDIKSMIQKVAAQYKISVVLDSSFAMKTTRQKNPQASLYLQNDDFDVLSSSLFHDLTNIDYDMPPDAKQIGATPEHMMLGGAYAKLDTLRKVAQLRSYLLPAASEFSPGAIFVMGNVDLTPHVAKEIFDKYQLPETIKTSYVKVINDFLNLENSRYVEDPPRYPNEVHGGTHE